MAYNQTKILEILDDWNFWGKTIDTGIKREEYLLRLIKKGVDPKNTLYINFEDPRSLLTESKSFSVYPSIP